MAQRWPRGYPLVSQAAFFFQNASKFTRVLPHDLKQSFSFCFLCSLEIAEAYLKNHQQTKAFLGAFRNWILFRVTQLITKCENSSFCSIRAAKTKREHPLVPTRSNGPSVQLPEAGGSAAAPGPARALREAVTGTRCPPMVSRARVPSPRGPRWGLGPFSSRRRQGPPRSPATEPPGGTGEPGLRPGRAGASSSCSSQRLQAEQPRIPASCRDLTPLFLTLLREILGVGGGRALEKSGEGRGELRGGSRSEGEPLGASQDMVWCWAQSWQLAA